MSFNEQDSLAPSPARFRSRRLATMLTSAASPKFFDDDPVWVERDTQDASGIKPHEVNLFVDLTDNLIAGRKRPSTAPRRERQHGRRGAGLELVHQSPRHRPLTPAEIAKGPNTTDGPAAGAWTVTSSKSDGVTPGFTVKDSTGQRWFLKFDPPGYRGMSTGTEVAVTKLMWALGYNVPENHIAYMQPRTARGRRRGEVHAARPATRARCATATSTTCSSAPTASPTAPTASSPARRCRASRSGRIRFVGTRPDDPNDIVPHEDRRELRGYGVFAAWLNHVDAKAINSLDMLVTENGRSFVRHYLIDFGSALGSGGVAPADYWAGSEYLVEPRDVARQMVGFGFSVPKWRTAPFYESRAIGRLPRHNADFNPELWKPRVPNQAFLHARSTTSSGRRRSWPR